MAKNGTAFLGREDVLQGRVRQTLEVKIGDKVLLLRELTAEEWLGIVDQETATKNAPVADQLNRAARLICLVAVDGDGKRLFTDEDAPALLSNLGASVVLEAYKAIANPVAAMGEPSPPTAR